MCISRQQARPYSADAYSSNGILRLRHQFAAESQEIRPPDCLGIMFGPTWVGQGQVMRPDCGGQYRAIRPRKHAFRTGCADIYT